MKPYANPNGKSQWSSFWEDHVNKKIRKIFKKSARQESKKITNISYENSEQR